LRFLKFADAAPQQEIVDQNRKTAHLGVLRLVDAFVDGLRRGYQSRSLKRHKSRKGIK
jgi:hypothetical protein